MQAVTAGTVHQTPLKRFEQDLAELERSLLKKTEDFFNVLGHAIDSALERKSNKLFVKHVLDQIPRDQRSDTEVVSRVHALAKSVDEAMEFYGTYKTYDVRHIEAVIEATNQLKKVVPSFSLAKTAGKDHLAQGFVSNFINMVSRLTGRANHEGRWITNGQEWVNWNDAVKGYPQSYKTPSRPHGVSIDQRNEMYQPLIGILKNSDSVRVVGAGHCFNTSACTSLSQDDRSGTMLSLDKYNLMARYPPDEAQRLFGLEKTRAERVVLVQTGARLRDFTATLWDWDLALPVEGSTDAQSIGGLIASDLHSTGRTNAFLSQRLLQVTLITGKGQIIKITRSSNNTWTTDESPLQEFKYLPVAGGIGMLGIVVDATLELDDAFYFKKQVQFVDTKHVESNLVKLLRSNDHISYYYSCGGKEVRSIQQHTWNRTEEEPTKSADLSRLVHEITEHVVTAFVPGLFTDIAQQDAHRSILEKILNLDKPVVLEAPLAFARRLYFLHDEIEYAVTIEDAVHAIHAVVETFRQQAFETIVEIRFAPGDGSAALLAPGTVGRGHEYSCFIGLASSTSTHDVFRSATVYQLFDDALKKFNARPHLGKKVAKDAAAMAKLYGDDWTEFQRLRRHFDPENKFLPQKNEFLKSLFLTEAAAGR